MGNERCDGKGKIERGCGWREGKSEGKEIFSQCLLVLLNLVVTLVCVCVFYLYGVSHNRRMYTCTVCYFARTESGAVLYYTRTRNASRAYHI